MANDERRMDHLTSPATKDDPERNRLHEASYVGHPSPGADSSRETSPEHPAQAVYVATIITPADRRVNDTDVAGLGTSKPNFPGPAESSATEGRAHPGDDHSATPNPVSEVQESIGLSAVPVPTPSSVHSSTLDLFPDSNNAGGDAPTPSYTKKFTPLRDHASEIKVADDRSGQGHSVLHRATRTGSDFGHQISSLGASISHSITDFVHLMAEQMSAAGDSLSHAAGDIAHDAAHFAHEITHADYSRMLEDVRRPVRTNLPAALAASALVGVALGYISSHSAPSSSNVQDERLRRYRASF